MQPTIYLLGAPGSGKGTQSAFIVQEYGYHHVNVGQLIRNSLTGPSNSTTTVIRQHLQQGQLIPTATTCELLHQELIRHRDAAGYIIDGYPRNLANLDAWLPLTRRLPQQLETCGAILLNLDEPTCIERCLTRSSGRADDNLPILQRRMTSYQEDTQPVLARLSSLGQLHAIDATGSPDNVYRRLRTVLQTLHTAAIPQQ